MSKELEEDLKILKKIVENNNDYLEFEDEQCIRNTHLRQNLAIKNILEEIEILDSNYTSLIESVSMIAQELNLKEDALIDEILVKIRELKEQLENKLKEKEEREEIVIYKLKKRIKEHTFKTEKDIEAQICTEILNQIEGEKENGI